MIWLLQLLRGFMMGTADIVPGVSGGTVALVLGIYERLITNVHSGAQALKHLLRGRLGAFWSKLAAVEWGWLLSLLAGVLLAVGLLSSVLEGLLNDYPIQMAGLFFGLVAASAVVTWRTLPTVDRNQLLVMAGVAVALFLLLGLRSETEVATGAVEVATKPAWIFFLAGGLAVCAMILPGISGSFILVMIGMYSQVLGAVNDRDFVLIAATGLGCIIGLALFSSLLTWLLDRYHAIVIAAMVGLMIGSLRVLWPWPNGTHTTAITAPSGPIAIPVALAAVGFALVVVVDQIASD